MNLENIMQDAIKQIFVSIKNAGMYTPNHPMTKNTIQKAYDVFNEALDAQGSLTLKTVEGKLIVNNKRIGDGKNPMFSDFADDLSKREVASVTFKKGITFEEFKDFVFILTVKPEKMESSVKNQLLEKNVKNINVTDLRYDRMGGGGGGGFSLPPELFSDVMLGKLEELGTKEKQGLTSEVTGNPDKVLAMLVKLAEHQTKGMLGQQKEIEKAAVLAKSINNLWDQAIEDNPAAKKKFMPELAKKIKDLPPETRSEVLKQQLESGDKDAAKAVANYFSLNDLAEIIPEAYKKDKSSVEDIKKMIKELIPNLKRRNKVIPVIGKKLVQMGMSQKEYYDIAEDALWEGLAINVKLERLLKRKKILPSDPEKFCNLIHDVIGKKRPDIAQKLTSKLLGGLKDDLRVRKSIVLESGKLLSILEKEPKLAKLHKAVVKIFDQIAASSETSEEIKAALKKGRSGKVQEEAKESEAVDPAKLKTYLKDIGQRNAADRKKIKKYAFNMGEAAITPILEMLNETEDAKDKGILMGMVAQIGGKKALDFFTKLLSSSDVSDIITGMDMLAQMNDETSLSEIGSLISHPDSDVKLKIIEILPKFDSDQTGQIWANFLQNESDAAIRQKLLDQIIDADIREAIPVMNQIASNEKEDELFRKHTIKTLGILKAEEAVSTLSELLEKRKLFGRPGESKDIREMCAYALGDIGTPQAVSILKKTEKSDPDKSVQHLCKLKLKDLGEE